MKLTQHFRLAEFTRSATADSLGIDNSPDPNSIKNLKQLCEQVLEPLRLHVGKPITVNSGYRCAALNRAVGGSASSQHQKGEAADLKVPSVKEGREWLRWIMDNCTFDQLIWEHNSSGSYWIHVSCRGDVKKNRHQVMSLG